MNIRGKASTAAAAGALLTITTLASGGLPAAAQAGTADAAAAGPVTHEENPRVPKGAAWTEAYFPSSDGSGVELHADVLRPAHLPAGAKTPVILSVGPYFAHAGQTGPEGWDRVGPSARFQDFVDGAGLMARGYTFVMVDLRGFGGSTGCLDWVGPGEQADVRAAVEWAARQPWSTGKVGMYGKSYDAVTGLVGNNLKLDSLKAVVAQEPVWDMYNYLFSNKVPRPNVTGTPNAYNSIATIPAMADDSDRYKANAAYEASHPQCLSDNLTNNNNPDPRSAYWRARDLAAQAAGTRTPLFVTQGFIEPNTKPEDMEEYLGNHRGRERGWLGQWEHVRGNDTDADGRLLQGRAGWFDEVMRFYDQYLRGITPSVTDPAYAVEDSLGKWRAQPTWPVATTSYDARLSAGRYLDDGGGPAAAARADGGQWDMEHAPRIEPLSGTEKSAAKRGDTAATSFWTWSTPAPQKVRMTATPRIRLNASATGNVMVRLWDLAPDGTGTMFDENVALLERRGPIAFDLKSTDWTFERGHRLGVQIGTIDSGRWLDVPSGNTIKVSDARLTLDVQAPRFDVPTQGDRSPYLDQYLAANTTTLGDVGPGTFPLRVWEG
ncbi:CocE/NonD family hydrolase [Nonomuraea jabiensis]|uniref:Putative CocE/NonD family hydrolase n=1 Tax=Nonomuraea jabiensis TaxID=882448 RepID=A0A7W9GIW1_9ACTN|nr:CocE/NonD family hydrolase [Nonomuraea jabiensis]MBB5784523.1 putative CocE/NonD family hydrolase [Nonomuraea jabiensis]